MQPQQVCYAVYYTLTINKQGTGSGTVTSTPAGIDCGQTCSADYPKDTQVTLTATPDPGSVFAGWGGDCASCGANETCQITMDSAKTCTATFNTQQQPTPSPTPTPQPSPEPTPGGGGGGGCSMGAGASPINALAYLLLPMLVALRRFIRR